MTTVFVSGSRKISRINDLIRERIKNIVEQGFQIVVGDANGADKALQKFLDDVRYSNVLVFCSGASCRNNVGNWEVRKIDVPPNVKGRDFYTQKDKAMAKEADYGFVLWDGKSAGSVSNVFELLRQGKKSVVYLSPEKRFINIGSLQDAKHLLSSCDTESYDLISKKIRLPTLLSELENANQGSLL